MRQQRPAGAGRLVGRDRTVLRRPGQLRRQCRRRRSSGTVERCRVRSGDPQHGSRPQADRGDQRHGRAGDDYFETWAAWRRCSPRLTEPPDYRRRRRRGCRASSCASRGRRRLGGVTFDLERFVRAQQGTDRAPSPSCGAAGRPATGSGSSSRRSPALGGARPWRLRWARSMKRERSRVPDPGRVIRECAGILVATTRRTAMTSSVRSTRRRPLSMTLFDRANRDEPAFRPVCARYFSQGADELTDAMSLSARHGCERDGVAAREGFDLRSAETRLIPGDEDPPAPGDQVMTRSARPGSRNGSRSGAGVPFGCSWMNLRFRHRRGRIVHHPV